MTDMPDTQQPPVAAWRTNFFLIYLTNVYSLLALVILPIAVLVAQFVLALAGGGLVVNILNVALGVIAAAVAVIPVERAFAIRRRAGGTTGAGYAFLVTGVLLCASTLFLIVLAVVGYRG